MASPFEITELPDNSAPPVPVANANMATQYAPNDAWSHHAPSPPIVHVHPPGADSNRNVLAKLGPQPVRYASAEFACAEFYLKINLGPMDLVSRMGDWAYEKRRNAQEILPIMWVGPFQAGRDKDFIEQEGITMLVAVRDISSANTNFLSPERFATRNGLAWATAEVGNRHTLLTSFSTTIRAINDHLLAVYNRREAEGNDNKLGKVLVYCESGNDRSPIIIAAYLMAMYGFTLGMAISAIQGQRFCVAFTDDLKHTLHTYYTLLIAKRQVAKQVDIGTDTPTNTHSPSKGQRLALGGLKRGMKDRKEEDEDEDMVMDEPWAHEDDEARFEGRDAWVPYRDIDPDGMD